MCVLLVIIVLRVLTLKHLKVLISTVYPRPDESDLTVSCSPIAPYTNSLVELPDSAIKQSADSTVWNQE